MNRIAAAVLVLGASSAAAAGEVERQYYAVMMSGQKMGHAVQTRSVEGGRVTMTMMMKLTMKRMGVPMSVQTTETTVETADGKPIAFSSVQNLGALPMKMQGRITDDGRVLVTAPGGRQRVMDWPEGALMSEGLRKLQIEKGLVEGTTYAARVFSPSNLQAMDATILVGPTTKVDLLGRVVMLTRMQVTVSLPAGTIVTTDHVDQRMNTLKSITNIGGMMMELLACDRRFALSDNDVVDFISRTILKAPADLTGLAEARAAVYKLVPVGSARPSFKSTDNQTVRANGDGSITLTVRPAARASGSPLPYAGDDPVARAALASGRFIQSDDPGVRALARKAVGDAKDAAEAVGRIEAFVQSYIKTKSLSVGYATAAEVVASREGDCSEHAVLTAAMCRAVGIPAQVVVGVVYVDEFAGHKGVFGGHAWTRAYVSGKWVGLDSTGLVYGPGHIAQAAGNGEPMDFFQILGSLGQFEIAEVNIER